MAIQGFLVGQEKMVKWGIMVHLVRLGKLVSLVLMVNEVQ